MTEKKGRKSKVSSRPGSLSFEAFSVLDEGFGLGKPKESFEAQKKKRREREFELFKKIQSNTEQKALLESKLQQRPLTESKSPKKEKIFPKTRIKTKKEIQPPLNKVLAPKISPPESFKKETSPKKEVSRTPLYKKPSGPLLNAREKGGGRKKTQLKAPSKAPLPAKLSPPSTTDPLIKEKRVGNKPASRHLLFLRHFYDLLIVASLIGTQVFLLKLFFQKEDYFLIEILWGYFTSKSFGFFNLLEMLALLYVCYFLYLLLFKLFVGKSLGAYVSEAIHKKTHAKKTKKVL